MVAPRIGLLLVLLALWCSAAPGLGFGVGEPCVARDHRIGLRMLAEDECGYVRFETPVPQEVGETLRAALVSNSGLLKLEFVSSGLGDDLLAVVMGALAEREGSLTALGVFNDTFAAKGVASLVDHFPPILMDLRLSNVGLQDAAGVLLSQAIKGSEVRTLDLTNNFLSDPMGAALAAVLPETHIGRLFLNGNQLGDPSALALVDVIAQGRTWLTDFEMLDNHLTEAGAQAMSGLQKAAQDPKVKLKKWRFNHRALPKAGHEMAGVHVPAMGWDERQVADWVRGLHPKFELYAAAFLENAVNGRLLLTLSEEDLTALIGNPLHRRRVHHEVVQLRDAAHRDL